MSQLNLFAEQFATVQAYGAGTEVSTIDGYSLNVPSVVAVARHAHRPLLDSSDNTKKQIAAAAAIVQRLALEEQSQYGITTGFGGSATTRTKQTVLLQKALIDACQVGILPDFASKKSELTRDDYSLMFPEDWIRGVMFVRLNSLIRAQSGTRWLVIDGLYHLLLSGAAPCVPLRQSISASGDLGPLAYISSVLTGHPDVSVWHGEKGKRRIVDAPSLLRDINLEPIEFMSKEGLSLVNGTGASSAVAALAIHDTHVLAVAAQVLSAFAVEAIKGYQEPFQPFTHDSARPHPGQIEVAANIAHVLRGSQLARVRHEESDPEATLRQDRYCFRGAPQWLGPQLEDIVTAQKTIDIELNSTTDNPLVDVENDYIWHGANFMAMAVTSAMEKTRLSLHHFAKLMFTQLTEILNHTMNRGLPPNLAVGEPSLDYSLKGAEIAAASYLSEVAYLANPVSTHVISAEMHNQAINSMALVSGRYTHEAIKLVRMLMSTHIYALCQAADLRAMQTEFRPELFALIESETASRFSSTIESKDFEASLFLALRNRVIVLLNETVDQDSGPRFHSIFTTLAATLSGKLAEVNGNVTLSEVDAWRTDLANKANALFVKLRDSYKPGPESLASKILGKTTKLYSFIRGELGVRMHYGDHLKDTTKIGTEISKIFRAFETPRMGDVLLEIMQGRLTGAAASEHVHGINGTKRSDTVNGHH